MTLTAIVVDDELPMCDELVCLLETSGEVTVSGICHNGDDALALLGKKSVDVLFVDIQMPGMTGMELAQRVARSKNPPLLVFVTAFSNYAVDAFEVDAVDYLLKPFDETDIERVIKRVKNRLGNSARSKPVKYLNKVLAEAGDRLEVIEINQIQFFAAEDRQVYLQTVDNKRYEIRNRLNELEGMLDPAVFFRCHRNFIVNINQIAQLANWFHRGYLLIMKNTLREIPVGRVYTAQLKNHFPI